MARDPLFRNLALGSAAFDACVAVQYVAITRVVT